MRITLGVCGGVAAYKSAELVRRLQQGGQSVQVVMTRAAREFITPLTFAYPSGASNAAIQTEVQGCGYGNARTAGSISPTGSTYAETMPPRSWTSK